MLAALSIVWMSFMNVVRATQRGDEMLDRLHHSEYAVEQLVSALRSAVFFGTDPKRYEFILEDNGSGEKSADIMSWVTSSAAFMPVGSPLADGLHRIFISIEDDEDGDPALAVAAHPYLEDPEEDDALDDIEFWIVSRAVQGFDVAYYDDSEEDWKEESIEDSKSLPRFIRFKLYLDPLEEGGDPVEVERQVDIPLGIYAKQKHRNARNESEQREEADAEARAAAGGTASRGVAAGPQTSVPMPRGNAGPTVRPEPLAQ